MFIARLFIFFSLSISILRADFEGAKGHILYLVHQGRFKEAVEKYQEISKKEGKPDFSVLENICLMLLDKGASSNNIERNMLAFYGAGLAMNQASIKILAKGVDSPDPQIQSLSLFFLSQISDRRSDELLLKGMSSDFLSTRMEAGYLLASKKHTLAGNYLESLLHKLPPFFRVFFPRFFALLGTNEAMITMREFLQDRNPNVRIEAISALSLTLRDDFMDSFLRKLPHATIGEQEAILDAFGKFKNSSCLALVEKYKTSTVPALRLAAYKSLYELGDRKAKEYVEKSAMAGDLFAVYALAELEGTEETLYYLLYSEQDQIKVNAAIALLTKRDPRCLESLIPLLTDEKLSIYPTLSLGKAHMSFRLSRKTMGRNKDETNYLREFSLQIKEQLLRESIHLGEEAFIKMAKAIFKKNVSPLIPQVMQLLENLRTEKVITLLQEQTQCFGAPLIRDYANLVLFRLNEKGNYKGYLIDWLENKDQSEIIKLRPHLSVTDRMNVDLYALSAEETSRLMIEILTSFAQKQDEESISIVLEAMKNGHPNNRYPLAGLLLRAME